MAKIKARVIRGNQKHLINVTMWEHTAKCIPCKSTFTWKGRNPNLDSIYVCQKCGGEMKNVNKIVMSKTEAKVLVKSKREEKVA